MHRARVSDGGSGSIYIPAETTFSRPTRRDGRPEADRPTIGSNAAALSGFEGKYMQGWQRGRPKLVRIVDAGQSLNGNG